MATHGQAQAPAPPDDAALIASAMQAAPKSIAEGATIIAMGADHKSRTLRQGSNGWTCMPDNPDSPGPDPMCMDANALAWGQAWIAQAATAGRPDRLDVHAGGRDRCQQHRPLCAGPDGGQCLGRDAGRTS